MMSSQRGAAQVRDAVTRWAVVAALWGVFGFASGCGDDDDTGANTGTDAADTAGVTGSTTGGTAGDDATDAGDAAGDTTGPESDSGGETGTATDTGSGTGATTGDVTDDDTGDATTGPPPEFANAYTEGDSRYAGQQAFLYDAWGAELLDRWPPAGFLAALMETEPEVFGNQYEKFGFIADPSDTFPVGFKRGLTDNTRVSFTCAGCHTAKLPDGRLWLGGATNADYGGFRAAVDERWVAAGNLSFYPTPLERDKDRAAGPGRLNHSYGKYPVTSSFDAPGMYTLGGRDRGEQMGQWRDIKTGTLLSVRDFGVGVPDDVFATVKFPSDAAMDILIAFMSDLPAPVGPAQDTALVEAGQAIFKSANCIACHTMTEKDGKLIPDPSRDGVIPIDAAVDGKERLPGEDAAWPDGSIRTSPVAWQVTQGRGTPDFPFEPTGDPPRVKFILQKGLRVNQTSGYRVSDLRGVWANAPYLHNGSVPTLEDLLTPAPLRATTFTRVNFTFKTTETGNENAGHEWGTDLPAADKAALIAFLKSL
jgi:hypothetical protein